MNNMAKNWKSILFYILIPVLLIGAVWYLSSNQSGTEVQYSQVVQMFEENQVKDFSLDLSSGALTYKTFKDPEKEQRYTVPNVSLFLDDVKDNVDAYNAKQTNNKNRITYNYKKGASGNWFTSMLPSLIMLIAIVGLGFYAFRRMNNAMMNDTNKTLGFGKIRAKTLVEDEKRKTTFQDVAGCDEEKGELEEIVEFLKNPDSFTALGARIPRGVLLVGPPGTGKTLLARAVAGEAGAPFLSISGSDFVEMYVGVGASRVRDLFEQAKKKAPAIVFIDEIDAVGRHRGAGTGGGNDEREQTLNQLLVEMDGFGTNSGIIVMAATNRPDVLDPALLRPGRFDRQITVNRPDAQGREDILKVHSRNKPLGPDVDLKEVAKDTIGFTGADLENLLNEAALLAAQQAQIDKLVGLRSQIIEDLRDNLSNVGQRVTVDRKTGAVTFESSVLFDTGRNEIKEAGKAALNSCIPVYIHTLLSEEYRDYVGEIIVEGHTDTTGQYLNNLALSQQRALAVATYCLSDEMVGLSYTDKETFKSIMTANGRADADPIYNADGTVNMDASRRVVIKFRMKDSDMIDQMSAILEGSAQGD